MQCVVDAAAALHCLPWRIYLSVGGGLISGSCQLSKLSLSLSPSVWHFPDWRTVKREKSAMGCLITVVLWGCLPLHLISLLLLLLHFLYFQLTFVLVVFAFFTNCQLIDECLWVCLSVFHLRLSGCNYYYLLWWCRRKVSQHGTCCSVLRVCSLFICLLSDFYFLLFSEMSIRFLCESLLVFFLSLFAFELIIDNFIYALPFLLLLLLLCVVVIIIFWSLFICLDFR